MSVISAHDTVQRPTVRVATLNLWGCGGEWQARREALRRGLRRLSPDVIAFQEAIHTDEYDQVRDIVPSDYAVVHQTVGLVAGGIGSCAAIATRFEVRAVREADLHVGPQTADYACATLAVELEGPPPIGAILFANHAPSWQLPFEHEREQQAVMAARLIESTVAGKDLHVVLAGDFNAAPDAASLRFWRGAQSLDGHSVCYRDAWESCNPEEKGHTFTRENPLVPAKVLELGRRVDHVLVRCKNHGPTLDVVSCERFFDRPLEGVWASDHFGVVAALALPPED